MQDVSHSILVVDDDIDLRDMLGSVLRFAGYRVLTADNGEAAVSLCNTEKPDLVLLDLVMPGLSGIETCKRIKAIPRHKDTPIIILTARDNTETISESFAVGAVDFIVKPINPVLLKQRLAYTISNQEVRQALKIKEKELSEAQRSAGMGTLRINTDNGQVRFSSSCHELLGLASGVNQYNLSDLLEHIHSDDRDHADFVLKRALEDKVYYMLEYGFITDDGRELIIAQQGEPVQDETDPEVVWLIGSLQDVTETRLAREEVEYQRLYDTLTGLQNRRFFETQLRHTLTHPPEDKLFAVVFIGLDHFTRVNDSLGHSGGDFVLREIANRLALYENSGHIVSRFGGDVFTLTIRNLSHIDDSNRFLEKVLADIREPILFGGHEVFITGSIGASLFPLESEDATLLVNGAEAAMIKSRNEGGDRYTYRTVDMNKESRRRTELLREMRSAINKREFVAYYQPQIDSKTMRIVGMEALVRWHHPERGSMPPDEFIELAEETGLIVPIGEHVLWQACRDTKRWRDMGFELRVGVNISGKQFEEDDVCDLISHAIEETGLPATALEVEITESMAVKDHQATVFKLDRLRQIGIKTSMDDFGTGYSSLSQLQQLPLDTLKVDQAFVRCIRFNEQVPDHDGYENSEIAYAVIAMAHSMGLNVIAEGVETEDQLRFLMQQDSDELQGFLFSKPLPADEFEELLKAGIEQTNALFITR